MHFLVFTSVALASLASAFPASQTRDSNLVGEMRDPLGLYRHPLEVDVKDKDAWGPCINFATKTTVMVARDDVRCKLFS